MGIGIKHAILFLILAPALICLSHAAGCAGSCVISGTPSHDYLGNPPVDPTMDTFDDFVRDKLDLSSLSTDPILFGAPSINSSLNQTNKGNVSLNSTTTYNVTDNLVKGTTDNAAVKLGSSDINDVSQSTIASTIFDNNMF